MMMMNENNNSIVGNNVIRNNDNVKSAVKTSSKQHKPNISTEKATTPSSPAFEFSDMESLRFSSDDDDDDENNILNSAAEDELEQHYENQIHHLQKEGQQLHKFYVKKCETNKKLTMQNKQLQKRITELTQIALSKPSSPMAISSSTAAPNVNSPISAINYLKTQVKMIYSTSTEEESSNLNNMSNSILKNQQEREEINEKYHIILKTEENYHNENDEKNVSNNNTNELLQNKINDLTSEMNEIKLFHESETLAFKEEIKSLTSENKTICEEMVILNSTLESSQQDLIDLNSTTLSLNNQLVKVQQLHSNLMESNRNLQFDNSTLKNEIEDLKLKHKNMIDQQFTAHENEKAKFLKLEEAKNREVIAVRKELVLLQDDVSNYENKLEMYEKKIKNMKIRNEKDLMKEKNSNKRIFAFGEKELTRLKNEVLGKNIIIDELKQKLKKEMMVTSEKNSNNKKKKDCQLLKDLQHENIQLKNKMSLLNTLLEKEQIRRKKAENTKPEDIISKHQTLKAMQFVQKQSSQNIKTFKASLNSTLNHALIQVNDIVNNDNNNNRNENSIVDCSNTSNNNNEILQKKIRSFFVPLREHLL